MTGEDLEVRSRALSYLFDTLISYGGDFPPRILGYAMAAALVPDFYGAEVEVGDDQGAEP